MSVTSTHQIIVQKGLEILIIQHTYTQREIHGKLKVLGFELSLASISNLWLGRRKVSPQLTKKAAAGIQEILAIEYCLKYDEATQSFEKISSCKPRKIFPAPPEEKNDPEYPPPTYFIHDGRRDVHQKVAFYQQAKIEIIELGIRLRNFKNYFSDKRESAFKDPLRQHLEKGVNFKCYVLDPGSNIARRYFEDRTHVQHFEKDTLASSPLIIKELELLFIQLNREGHDGRMELYLYDHFPYYHATIVDGNTERGQMMISPYLYGVTRANAPVIELSHQHNKVLFKRYWQSVKAFTSQRIQQVV